jgi:hypothetical protein
MKGDLLEVILVAGDEFPLALLVFGVGDGGSFWIRCERRGVADGESISSLL